MKKTTYKLLASRPKTKAIIERLIKDKSTEYKTRMANISLMFILIKPL